MPENSNEKRKGGGLTRVVGREAAAWRFWVGLLFVIGSGAIALYVGAVRHMVDASPANDYGIPWRLLMLFVISTYVPMLPLWRRPVQRAFVATALVLVNCACFTIGYTQGLPDVMP